MTPIKNISLIHECDPPTLERAATLAKASRARLTLVYPVTDVPDARARLTIGRHTVDVRRLVRQEHEARLKEAARAARALGVRPATRLLVGQPFLEIIRDVIEHRRDLVVMTAEGRGGLRERLFGSTSRHLMRKCPVPLLVMKPGRGPRFHRVLAAVDPDVTGGSRDTLNDFILALASWLATGDGAELHIVHAWSLLGESLFRGHAGVSALDVDRAVRDEAGRRRRHIDALVDRCKLAHPHLHLPKGDPAVEIPRLVRSADIDLLVMGTVCRTGIPGFIMGNTAERVLDSVDCSVLTVKPTGFVSPVAPLVTPES